MLSVTDIGFFRKAHASLQETLCTSRCRKEIISHRHHTVLVTSSLAAFRDFIVMWLTMVSLVCSAASSAASTGDCGESSQARFSGFPVVAAAGCWV